MNEETINSVRKKYFAIKPFLNERSRRLWAAVEAISLGRGGKVMVSAATNLSRTTVHRGIKELEASSKVTQDIKIRAGSGGRKALVSIRPELVEKLKNLVEDTTCGYPESPLLWTCKSTRQLSEALNQMGYKIGRQKISE